MVLFSELWLVFIMPESDPEVKNETDPDIRLFWIFTSQFGSGSGSGLWFSKSLIQIVIFIMNGTGLTQGREELVRLDTIEMVYGKKKNDKEARMASIKKGIEIEPR